MSTGKVIELIGQSKKSWDDAVKVALKDARKTIRNIKCVDVVKFTGDVDSKGNITAYRATVKILFVVER